MRSLPLAATLLALLTLQAGSSLQAAPATPDAAADDGAAGFASCVAGLVAQARARGFSADTLAVLQGVAYQPRVIELDRSQPEFTASFTDYFDRRVSDTRISKGRALLVEHADLLQRVQHETGVPAQYLVAFWGLETNFGSFLGSTPIADSLATLACDQRRSRFFTGELLAALEIINRGDLRPEQMRGSWAGAMGQVQFMPSVYLQHAADGDADRRRDLFASIPDALLSAGRFLAALGWQTGTRWGREVLLPAGFDYGLAWQSAPRPLRDWAALGITDVHGQRLPALDLPTRLHVPAGHRGPAFISYHNFDVIMGWNRSTFYALSVGVLADRIKGAGNLQRPPPADAGRLARAEVQQLQLRLAALGFDVGEPDGLLGPATRGAVSAFQATRGLVADGYVDPPLLAAVQAASAQP